MSSDEKILTNLILEIIGKPAEHLVETLSELVKQIENEAGVKVLDKKINEPIEMKEQKEFYSSFAVVEIEAKSIDKILEIIFKYMPSHIEIVSPEKVVLSNNDWSLFLSELARKLHAYDEVARVIQNEKFILEKKFKETMKK